MSQLLTVETAGGEPIRAGGYTITPFVKSIRVKFPFLQGGLVWNRPVSILARDAGGQEQVIRILDVTRQVQWGLLGASALSLVLAILVTVLRNKKS